MIIDALILAEPYMKIAHRVFQPDKYLHLTDEIMGWIEANEDPVSIYFSTHPSPYHTSGYSFLSSLMALFRASHLLIA